MIREITVQGALEIRKIREAEDADFLSFSNFRRASSYNNLVVSNERRLLSCVIFLENNSKYRSYNYKVKPPLITKFSYYAKVANGRNMGRNFVT